MKYSQYPVASELNAADLIALSQAPHTAENNTFKTVTPEVITNYIEENAELQGTDQVAGLDAALNAKVNKSGDTMIGNLVMTDFTSNIQSRLILVDNLIGKAAPTHVRVADIQFNSQSISAASPYTSFDVTSPFEPRENVLFWKNLNSALATWSINGTTGAAVFNSATINGLTANTVAYLNDSKQLTSSAITPTQLGYLFGVTDAIQTQLNNKVPAITVTQSTTAKTLNVSDAYGSIYCTNNTGTTTITVPANTTAAIPVGAVIKLYNRTGNQLISLSPAVGVTLIGGNETVGNNGYIFLEKTSTDTWQVIDLFESGMHDTDWANLWSAAVAGDVLYTRKMKQVTLIIPNVQSSPGPAVAIASMQTVLPPRLRPSADISAMIRIKDNNTLQAAPGLIDIFSWGEVFIYKSLTGGTAWTVNGINGWTSSEYTYLVA